MERTSRTVKISGERLAVLWRESLMSQESFAHAVGMKRSGFLRLMQPGEHGMFTDNFRALAEAVRMTPEQLRRRIGLPLFEGPESTTTDPSLVGVSGVAQPLHEITQFHGISAGGRDERMAVSRGPVKVPQDLAEFAARIDGDSMLTEYPNNATALFENVDSMQLTCGKDYLLWFADGECYFSRVFESNEDSDVLLLSKLNPDRKRFPDRTIYRREIVRVALCVGVLISKK